MDGTKLLNNALLTMGMGVAVTSSASPGVVRTAPLNTQALIVQYNNPNSSTRYLGQNTYSLDKLKLNKHKLKTYKSFQRKWDGYDGNEFDEETINSVENILSSLTIQPQVFPTSRGTIQIEKYFAADNFYEVEIDKQEIFAYIVTNKGELEKNVEIEELISLLTNFNA